MSEKDTWFVELDAETTREPREQDLEQVISHLGGTSPALAASAEGVRVSLAVPDRDEGFFTGAESAIIRAASLVEKALAAADLGASGFAEIHATRGDRSTGSAKEQA